MDQTINFNEQNKNTNKRKNKKKNKTKQNRQPEGLYILGSGMLVFSRTLLGS